MRNYLMGLILSKAASRVGRYASRKVGHKKGVARPLSMRGLLVGAGIAAAAAWVLSQKKGSGQEGGNF